MHKQFLNDTIQELVKMGSLVARQGPELPVVVKSMGIVKTQEGQTVLTHGLQRCQPVLVV